MATVLAVDDEEDILTIIRHNLEREGHRVLTAPDGDRALELVRQERPDVVVLDVMMPGTDGWGVLKRIKAESEELSTIPVLMLTARSTDEDRIRGGIEGAIRYLTKPFSPRAAATRWPRPSKESLSLSSGARSSASRFRNWPDSRSGRRRADPAPGLQRKARPPLPGSRAWSTCRAASPTATSCGRCAQRLDQLSAKQLELLHALEGSDTVSQAATDLGVSRSNVYASLRRISRKLGVRSVPELLAIVRTGELFAALRPP